MCSMRYILHTRISPASNRTIDDECPPRQAQLTSGIDQFRTGTKEVFRRKTAPPGKTPDCKGFRNVVSSKDDRHLMGRRIHFGVRGRIVSPSTSTPGRTSPPPTHPPYGLDMCPHPKIMAHNSKDFGLTNIHASPRSLMYSIITIL